MLPIVEVGLSMTVVCTCGFIDKAGKTFFRSIVPGASVVVVSLCARPSGTCSTFDDEDAAFCFVHS
jgi:hypothetical protein